MLAKSASRRCSAAQRILLSSELLNDTGQAGRPSLGRSYLRRLPTGPVERWKPQIDKNIQLQTCVVQCKSTAHKRVTCWQSNSNGKQLFCNDTTTRQKRGEVCRANQTLTNAADDPRSSHAAPTLDLSYLELRNVAYQPPGCETPILNDVNLSLDRHSLGLIFGRSGSGKTTLLQILAGLAAPTTGSLHLHSALYASRGPPLNVSEVSARTGLVFQFPERYFLTDSVADELLFGHMRRDLGVDMYQRVATALHSVGMDHISMQTEPRALSDGYKRRLALAVQLVRQPDILLLDEPLAGLDWEARMDVVQLLKDLKRTTTLVVVSHDLRELTSLVDKAWRMCPGGQLREEKWPLDSGSGRLELFE